MPPIRHMKRQRTAKHNRKIPLTRLVYYATISRHARRGKYRGVEQLEARRAHNPEVVGSSPASATRKEKVIPNGMAFFFSPCVRSRTRTHLNATRTSVAAEGLTEAIFYFLSPAKENANRVLPTQPNENPFSKEVGFLFVLFIKRRIFE